MSDGCVDVVPYEASHREAFKQLNEAWISRYFRLEAPDLRVLEAGYRLGEAAKTWARAAGASRLILESNTILEPAIALYRKLGFTEFSGVPSEYDRCNIHMELDL